VTTPVPDFKWYSSESKRLGLPSLRCPFASLHGCPKYYESRSLLGKAGSTELAPELEKQLEAKWKGHPLAPQEMEQTPELTGDGTHTTGYSNFCPEVLADRFALFVTGLYKFHDELERDARQQSLTEEGAPDDDPRWNWSGLRAQHYSECPVYAPLSHDWPKLVSAPPLPGKVAPVIRFDVFISHASEDKEDFVRPLAAALAAMGLRVWFDEWTLKLGDGLRKEIDKGLLASDFGVVVLSRAFFAKNWTQAELEGLFAKEMEGRKFILPIWHNVTKADVLKYSPMLAGKLAAPTNEGVEAVARKIYAAVRPQSPAPPAIPPAPARATKVRPSKPEPEHVQTVAERFVEIFGDHGVAKSQIPRFLPEISLDKLRNWEVLASVLTPEVLDKAAKLFGLKRLWLDGIEDQIYDRDWCYKQPQTFFEDLINLKEPGHFPVSAIIDCEQLDMHSEAEQNIVIVLSESLADLEEQEICRYTIYQDSMHWDYWKCRHQLKAMARVYHEATGKIVPLYHVSAEEWHEVAYGRRVPRAILEGQFDRKRNLEEYAIFPGEGSGAPEMEEAPKVKEYIQEERLEEWGKKLRQNWGARISRFNS